MMYRLEPGEHASAIVAVWDQRAGTILRSNAGHPPVLRCRAGEFDYLTPPPGGLLLGVRSDWVYREEIEVLRPGTTVVFYTDGLVERRGQGIETGMSELLERVKGATDLSPASLCDRILDWRDRSAPREDDVCLLAARLA
jgi:serine phosphatase RsbU (regulator of sigma subunit)